MNNYQERMDQGITELALLTDKMKSNVNDREMIEYIKEKCDHISAEQWKDLFLEMVCSVYANMTYHGANHVLEDAADEIDIKYDAAYQEGATDNGKMQL